MSDKSHSLGARIRHIRLSLKLSQGDFAEKIGRGGASTIGGYEKDRRIPDAHSLRAIARLGNVSLDWLLTGEGEMFAGQQPQKPEQKTNWTMAEPPGPEWDSVRKKLFRHPDFQHICNLLAEVPEDKWERLLDLIANCIKTTTSLSKEKEGGDK